MGRIVTRTSHPASTSPTFATSKTTPGATEVTTPSGEIDATPGWGDDQIGLIATGLSLEFFAVAWIGNCVPAGPMSCTLGGRTSINLTSVTSTGICVESFWKATVTTALPSPLAMT